MLYMASLDVQSGGDSGGGVVVGRVMNTNRMFSAFY